jgi:acetoin utilization protein AcuB
MTTIRQIVKRPAIAIREEDQLALALQMMAWGDVRHLPVVSGDQVLGVVSERDLLRCYADRGRAVAAREKVGAIMHSPAVTVGPDTDLVAAIRLVTGRKIGCLPVIEGGGLLGIVTRSDLLAAEVGDAGDDVTPSTKASWEGLVVDDVMSPQPVSVAVEASLRSALERMDQHGVRHLPIVDGERKVIGILSDRDIRTVIGNPMRTISSHDAMARIESARVGPIMTPSPMTLRSGTPLGRAARVFSDHKVGVIPIVDDHDRLLGVLSYTDVLRGILGPKQNLS